MFIHMPILEQYLPQGREKLEKENVASTVIEQTVSKVDAPSLDAGGGDDDEFGGGGLMVSRFGIQPHTSPFCLIVHYISRQPFRDNRRRVKRIKRRRVPMP